MCTSLCRVVGLLLTGYGEEEEEDKAVGEGSSFVIYITAVSIGAQAW